MRQAALAAGLIMCLGLQGAAQRDVKPRTLHSFSVEGRGGAATLDELVAASDLIVEGTVGADVPANYGDWPDVNTMFDVDVAMVFRASTKVPAVIRQGTHIGVRRWGGESDRADRVDVYLADNYPMFVKGQRLMLFLKSRTWAPPAPYTGSYFTEATYGPDSAFEIAGDLVRPFGTSRLSLSLAQGGATRLRAQLRRP